MKRGENFTVVFGCFVVYLLSALQAEEYATQELPHWFNGGYSIATSWDGGRLLTGVNEPAMESMV